MDFAGFIFANIWIIYVGGYSIIFAFACMAVAGAKGYNRASWWFIGLIIGIIGLIIIACFPSNEKLNEKSEGINSKHKYRGL